MDSGRPIVLIGTYHSLAGERFQTILKDAVPHSKSLLFIADEVHRLGAPYFQNGDARYLWLETGAYRNTLPSL